MPRPPGARAGELRAVGVQLRPGSYAFDWLCMKIVVPPRNRTFGALDALGLIGLCGLLVARFIPVARLIPFWGCSFRQITGYPCPGCGLTRVADRFAHFHWLRALEANPRSSLRQSGRRRLAGELSRACGDGRWRRDHRGESRTSDDPQRTAGRNRRDGPRRTRVAQVPPRASGALRRPPAPLGPSHSSRRSLLRPALSRVKATRPQTVLSARACPEGQSAAEAGAFGSSRRHRPRKRSVRARL